MGQLSQGPMGSVPEGHAPKVIVQGVAFHKAQITVESGVISALMMVFQTVDGNQHAFLFDNDLLVPMFEGALKEADILVEGEVVDGSTD